MITPSKSILIIMLTVQFLRWMRGNFAYAGRPNLLLILADDMVAWTSSTGKSPNSHTSNMERLAVQEILLESAFLVNAVCPPVRAPLLTGCYSSVAGMVDDNRSGSSGNFLEGGIECLAAEGMRFEQVYSGGAVCSLSRSSLMICLHSGQSVARGNEPRYHTCLKDEDVTMAEVLKHVGYLCGGVGKWSGGSAKTVGRLLNQGFAMWLGRYYQNAGHYCYPDYLEDSDCSEGGVGRFEFPNNAETWQHFSHGLFTDRALKFIRDSAKQGFQFFPLLPMRFLIRLERISKI